MCKQKIKRILGLLILVLASVHIIKTDVFAVPTLQLYIEGAQYDSATETWVINSTKGILWVLGDVGKYGTIYDVKLATAYNSNEIGNINFTSTQATSITDPSIPATPSFDATGVNNQPLMGDGNLLPAHGIYGPGIAWNTYSLGNFTLTDSPIGDFTTGVCPGGSCTYPDLGQINAYEFNISGYSWVHFDAFDHIVGSNHSKFAPFSHDGDTTVIPEPASIMLLGLGLVGLLGLKKRKIA